MPGMTTSNKSDRAVLFAGVQCLLSTGNGANGMVALEDVAQDIARSGLVVHNQKGGLVCLG